MNSNLIIMPSLSNVPGAPDATHPAPITPISAVGDPVHAAVPRAVQQDTSPEILARAIADLFENPDVVWRSTNPEWANRAGKANFLRLTSEEKTLWLDVIKPWVRFSTGVKLGVTEDELPIIRDTIINSQWIQAEEEWFLPSTVPDHDTQRRQGLRFDPNGATRPGAIFVFNRIRILQEPSDDKPGLMLRWIGKHTNPAAGETNFRVDDTLHTEEI